jgi:hypothetical protein
LDLARLANDPDARIDFMVNYWKDYVDTTLTNILKRQGFDVKKTNETILATDIYGKQKCITHPLWSESFVNKIIGKLPGDVSPVSIIEISKLTN